MADIDYDENPAEKINKLSEKAAINLNSAINKIKSGLGTNGHVNNERIKSEISENELSPEQLLTNGQNNLKSISLESVKQKGGEVISIKHNSLNNSYLEVFGKYLTDSDVVELNDPDLMKTKGNLRCLHALLEVFIIKQVKYVFIVTHEHPNPKTKENFKNIIDACRNHRKNFFITFTYLPRHQNCDKCLKIYQSHQKIAKITFDEARPSFPDTKSVLNNCKSFFTAKLNQTGINYFMPPDYNLVQQNQWQPGFQNYSLKPARRVDITVTYTKWKDINSLQLGLLDSTLGELKHTFDELANEDGNMKFLSEDGKNEFVRNIDKIAKEISFTQVDQCEYASTILRCMKDMYHRACLRIRNDILSKPIEGFVKTESGKQEVIVKTENEHESCAENKFENKVENKVEHKNESPFGIKREWADRTAQNIDDQNSRNKMVQHAIKTETSDDNSPQIPDYDDELDQEIFGSHPKRRKL